MILYQGEQAKLCALSVVSKTSRIKWPNWNGDWESIITVGDVNVSLSAIDRAGRYTVDEEMKSLN